MSQYSAPQNERKTDVEIPKYLENEAGDEGNVLTVPETADPTTGGSGYRVILYNDDYHAMDDVVEQLIKATACSLAQAVKVMTEAHFKGRAVCFRGEREKCQKVVAILREIRLQCEVDCD